MPVPPRRIIRYLLLVLALTTTAGILLRSRVADVWQKLPAFKQRGDSILSIELETLAQSAESTQQQSSTAESQYDFKPGRPVLGYNYTRVIVVPKTKKENVTWLHEELPDVPKAIYEVDNRNAELRPPKNKGNEVMVYLSYIIDHYDKLADVNIFIHAHRWAWHNNDLFDSDTALLLQHLKPDRVIREGYMNLRCQWYPGCPAWLHPNPAQEDEEKKEEKYVATAWAEIFPGRPLPEALAQPCCSQFAVSKERIRAIPLGEYVRIRKWVLRTRLGDNMSGRVFEYLWQYLFTGQTTLCPQIHACYCDGYGACFEDEEDFQGWFKTRFELRQDEWELQSWVENEAKYQELLKKGRKASAAQVERAPEGRISHLKLGVRQRWLDLWDRREVALVRGQNLQERARIAGRDWTEAEAYEYAKQVGGWGVA